MHTPTIAFLAPACVLALSWLGVGRLLPARSLPDDRLLAGLTRLGAGALAVSLLVFALGRVGLLDGWLLDAVTAAAAAAGLWSLRGVRPRLPRVGRVHDVLLAAVAVALALDLVAATAPITSADALKYHLALPKLWLQLGSIGDPFWRWEGFDPSGVEMLYTQGLALGGASTAAVVHAFLAAGCAAALYGFARALAGPAAGAAAAALFTLQGIVTWEATSSFVDLGLTFYAVLAAWYAWRRGALWAGAFAGAAAGTKYLGLAAVALVVVTFLARRRIRDASGAAATAAAAGGWWYLRNAIVTGNPVYPLVFGGKWLTPFARARIHGDLAQYGVGGGALRLVLLPYDLVVHGNAFDRGRYVDVAIFAFALLGVVTGRRALLGLAAAAVAYLVLWHAESQQARFLLPALAVLAVVGGAGVAAWWETGGLRRGAVAVVLVLVGAAWLVSSGALTRRLVPIAFGADSRPAFLQRLTGTYDALRAARAATGAGTIGLVDYAWTFNVPGRAVTIDVPEFTPELTRAVYVQRLRQLGVRTVLSADGADDPLLAPVRGCLRRLARYHARLVTSRTLGQSVPLELDLYSLAGCA